MENGSWAGVILRALAYGTCMGGFIGGPLIGGAIVVLGAVGGDGATVDLGIFVTLVGGLIGAAVGFACSVVAGLVLASARGFFLQHALLARVFAGLACGLLLDLIASLIYDDPAISANDREVVIAGAFTLGAAVAAMSVRYVVSGNKCFIVRHFLD